MNAAGYIAIGILGGALLITALVWIVTEWLTSMTEQAEKHHRSGAPLLTFHQGDYRRDYKAQDLSEPPAPRDQTPDAARHVDVTR